MQKQGTERERKRFGQTHLIVPLIVIPRGAVLYLKNNQSFFHFTFIREEGLPKDRKDKA